MRTLLVGEDVDDFALLRLLESYGGVVTLGKNPRLPSAVAAHADMQLLCVGDTYVIAENLAESAPAAYRLLCRSGKRVILSEAPLSERYPCDCILNAKPLGKRLLCRVASTDEAVKRLCAKTGIELLNVKQGYAACSTLVFKYAAVTADRGIASALSEIGFDVLKLESGGIRLDGYDYGFIGGASFFDPVQNTVFFFGTPERGMSGLLEEFLKRHSTGCRFLSETPLYDCGGAVIIDTEE